MNDSIRLYSEQGFLSRFHIIMRHLLSPLELVEARVPEAGNILDLGCGHGLFTNYMALKAPSRNILGVDPAPEKIEIARKTEAGVPNVSYLLGSIEDVSKDKPFDAITIVDVLYLLPEMKQKEILDTCYRLLADSGILVLKAQDTKPRWRYLWMRIQESVMVGMGLTHGKGLHFMPVARTRQLLEEAGFQAECHRLPSRIFYPNVVFIGYKNRELTHQQ